MEKNSVENYECLVLLSTMGWMEDIIKNRPCPLGSEQVSPEDLHFCSYYDESEKRDHVPLPG